jgi:hypothetical protein
LISEVRRTHIPAGIPPHGLKVPQKVVCKVLCWFPGRQQEACGEQSNAERAHVSQVESTAQEAAMKGNGQRYMLA